MPHSNSPLYFHPYPPFLLPLSPQVVALSRLLSRALPHHTCTHSTRRSLSRLLPLPSPLPEPFQPPQPPHAADPVATSEGPTLVCTSDGSFLSHVLCFAQVSPLPRSPDRVRIYTSASTRCQVHLAGRLSHSLLRRGVISAGDAGDLMDKRGSGRGRSGGVAA